MPRYEIREYLGKFSVVDAYTGEPVRLNGQWLDGLDYADADDSVELLNTLEWEQPEVLISDFELAA